MDPLLHGPFRWFYLKLLTQLYVIYLISLYPYESPLFFLVTDSVLYKRWEKDKTERQKRGEGNRKEVGRGRERRKRKKSQSTEACFHGYP